MSRVIQGVNENKTWYAFTVPDTKTALEVYNDFVSCELDHNPLLPDLQTARITACVGRSKNYLFIQGRYNRLVENKK